MVRRKEEAVVEKKKMFGGAGEAVMQKILNGADEMYGKGRLFNYVTLEPGGEIAWHVHHGDGETYFILTGVGEYNDNGTILNVYPGDTTFVDAEEGHSLKNVGEEPLTAIALILYKD